MCHSSRGSKRRAATFVLEILRVAFALRREGDKSLQATSVGRECCVRAEATFVLVTFSEQALSRAAAAILSPNKSMAAYGPIPPEDESKSAMRPAWHRLRRRFLPPRCKPFLAACLAVPTTRRKSSR